MERELDLLFLGTYVAVVLMHVLALAHPLHWSASRGPVWHGVCKPSGRSES